jgi:hypothetical protein
VAPRLLFRSVPNPEIARSVILTGMFFEWQKELVEKQAVTERAQ